MTSLPALPTAQDLDAILRIAEALSRADGMIPKQYVGSPPKILAAVLKGRELGIDAMASLNAFHVVEGKPVASSEFWAARLAQAGYRIEWPESTETRATVRLTARDGRTHTDTWTIEMAQRAGLTGKQNWKGHPNAMLRARAITSAGRAFAAEVMFGAAIPDEIEEIRDVEAVVRTEQAQEAARGVAGLQARLGIAVSPMATTSTSQPQPATAPEESQPAPFDTAEHAIAAIAEADKGTLRAIMARVAASGFAGTDAETVKRAKDDRVAELQQVTA